MNRGDGNMSEIFEKVTKCFEIVQSKTALKPKVALVLGSGLGGYADEVDVADIIDYSDIERFPVSTVPGHHGQFIFGHVQNVPVVIMKGRVHYYEGYPISDVVLPIRLMRLLGAECLFLTNAVGGINRNFSAGEFMLIRDHILFSVPSPLIGPILMSSGPDSPI
jgi:purine-nucleoside phosphorylase